MAKDMFQEVQALITDKELLHNPALFTAAFGEQWGRSAINLE
jgi:hypothetical protein